MSKLRESRSHVITGFAFGIGFSIGSLVFNVVLQAVLFGVFRVLGLGR
jgi:hypothetical protein